MIESWGLECLVGETDRFTLKDGVLTVERHNMVPSQFVAKISNADVLPRELKAPFVVVKDRVYERAYDERIGEYNKLIKVLNT